MPGVTAERRALSGHSDTASSTRSFMKSRLLVALAFAAAVVTLAATGAAQAPVSTDWPQWRGPDRDGISKETGLLQTWPAKGPAVLWTIRGLGRGYGSLAVRGDRIFVQSLRGRQ